MELRSKKALVTGAGAEGGIGFQIASALHREGAHVIITGRDEDRGRKAARALGDRAQFIHADITDLASVQNLAEQAEAIDILVNNAALATPATTTEQSIESFDAIFSTNVRGPYFGSAVCRRVRCC